MKRVFTIVLLMFVLSSCSLFKMTISTGDTPLSVAELNTRMMTRGFYNEFTNTVIQAADSIVATTTNVTYKINAIKWKMEATSACAVSSMQTVPEVALLNTWVMCRQMESLLVSTPKSKLFGAGSDIAIASSKELLAKIEKLALRVLTTHRFAQMSDFVDQYSSSHKGLQTKVMPDNLMLDWVQFLGGDNTSFVKSVGSMSEVLSDMNDRVSSYSGQFANELSWSKDMITMRLEQDSTRDKLALQLDSVARDFKRMVLILEHSPELIDVVSNNFNKQITSLIGAMNVSVDNAFANIASEREALQIFFAEQRELLMKETQVAADTAVKSALNSLPSVLGKILIYVVLAAIVLFTLPFVLGWWLGGLRQRHRQGKIK